MGGPRDLAHGTDYAYRLDGGGDLPDPRSALQPDGVHGPSRRVDPSTWAGLWTDIGWEGRPLVGSLVYELHVGTFTPRGTLETAVERLGHLATLGVDLVELMPLASFPGRAGWGYDGVDLWSVHEAYGGPAALARFVDAAHAVGIGVCLDVVYNHLGPSGNYLAAFGPYFTDAHHTPWGEAVNYDQPGCEQVRAFVIDSALRWFTDFHVDALRLDAIHAIEDSSPRHVLADLADATHALAHRLGRPLSLVAESDLNDAGVITPTDAPPPATMPSLGMDAQWADDVHHALHVRLTGETQGYYADFARPQAFTTAYGSGFLHAGTWSSFRDQVWGAPLPEGTDPRRLVVFGSDHDQVGNRATGDRPSATLDDDHLAAGAALVLLSAYTPMLFMGEEWGTRRPFQFFTDHVEPDLAEAVSAERRAEFSDFGWDSDEVPDPQDPATVLSSTLDWSEIDDSTASENSGQREGHRRMLAWYRDLVELRRRVGLGSRSSWPTVRDESDLITVDHGDLLVAANLSGAPQELALPTPADAAGAVDDGTTDGGDAGAPAATTWEVALAWGEARHDGTVLHLAPGATVALLDSPAT